MPQIKRHQCHNCPSNEVMCDYDRHKFCHGFFKKSATTQMARQISDKWDGKFRFPRTHINGKSLQDFTKDQLKQMQKYYHSIWHEHWKVSSKIAMRDRPDWSPEVKQAHERQIDIILELRRRHELRRH